MEKEKGIYKEGIGYIWDEYQIPCYNIVVDHPYYYHNRLKDLPKKYHHISIDGKQAAYFKAFYPEYDHLGFLPLAGTPISPSGLEMDQGLASMDVILTGNFTPTSFCESYIYRINEEQFLPGYDIVIVARTRAVDAEFQALQTAYLCAAQKLGLLRNKGDEA